MSEKITKEMYLARCKAQQEIVDPWQQHLIEMFEIQENKKHMGNLRVQELMKIGCDEEMAQTLVKGGLEELYEYFVFVDSNGSELHISKETFLKIITILVPQNAAFAVD